MLRFFRRRTGPLHHLRKDTATPNGTIWSCHATDENLAGVAGGEIADAEHRLNVGDIINLRPQGSRRAILRLRVTGRHDDRVVIRKLRDGAT